MREFTIQNEERLDEKTYDALKSGDFPNLLPCSRIRYNNTIRLCFFTDGCRSIAEQLPDMELEEICAFGKKLIPIVQKLEADERLHPENIVWDMDSIYVREDDGEIFLLELPVLSEADEQQSEISRKRVRAILEGMLRNDENGEDVIRQIDYETQKTAGWESILAALDKRRPVEDSALILRGVNTPIPLAFEVGREDFVIGSDPEHVSGLLVDMEGISPRHALIGWNNISFYVKDLGSANGTFLNDVQVPENSEVPIGKGSTLRFASYVFQVE